MKFASSTAIIALIASADAFKVEHNVNTLSQVDAGAEAEFKHDKTTGVITRPEVLSGDLMALGKALGINPYYGYGSLSKAGSVSCDLPVNDSDIYNFLASLSAQNNALYEKIGALATQLDTAA